ncbi:hypothetical protein DUNSADRAFT_18598 [Dunaliella salina]|uniref:Uncharacterized protein n=1 Tax=Dunaliella salina TaxID=3046 RepID=A0ABQ7FZU8_DUNSA|nr:hypothetical protein DUNSADRAFT_18598 [Dunaliella salina]|eukprot:KAF5827879.1 hypothetical protein DUNSADRAFT_18598 [Dunaliella salina]
MGYQEALIVPWKTPVVSCQAEIVFSRPLEPNTEYFLQLSLEQSDVMKERVHGLSPFHFYFLDGLAHRVKLRSKYFMLYLPHGLSPQNTSQQLSQQLRICKSADAILGLCESESLRAFAADVPAERKHRSIALMHVPELEPSQNYSIWVQANASIQDAFGQPLQGSNGSFVTQDPPALFLRPSSKQITTIKPRSKPLKWPFLVKVSHIETSTTEENKAAQLDLMLRPGYPVQLASVGCVEQRRDGKRCWDWHLQLLLQANISASAWVSSSQDDLLAWVTHAGTDQQQQRGPVLGAHVFFFKIDNGKDTQGIIGSCHTNEQGLCHVAAQAPAYMGTVKLVAVVLGPAGDALYLRMGSLSERDDYPTYLGKLVLDRAIVPLGDTLHVTGYVQEQSAAGRLHAPRQNMSALLDVYIDGQELGASVVTSLSEHGSLHASIPVPKLSKPGRYICYLRLNDEYLTSESFVVSDPRPPTATLVLDAPAWSKPNVSVPVGLRAISYLGNQVSGADVTVKWSCPGIPNGEKAVRTNDKGKAQLAIPLQSPENDCRATNGGILTVNAEWVGPTREPIFQTTRTKLDHSSVRVALSRSIDTVLPGVQFSPLVEVISNVNGTSLKGVPVAVLVAPVGWENMCDVDTKCMQPQTCSVISGVPVSKTFDCDRPQTLHMATSIIVEEDRSLDVKLSSSTVEEDAPALSGVDEHVFEPGQPIKLSASSFLGGEEEMRDTEITLIAVDKAMLDMVSYKLPNVQKAFHVDLSWPSHRLMSMDPNRINSDIKEAIFAILLKHLQLSPWTGLPPSTWYEDFGRDFTSVSIDNISEEDCSHLAESIDTLTPRQFPRCSLGVVAEKNSQGSCVFWPELSCFPPPPPSNAPSSPFPPMARGPSDAPRDASEFVATPLFYTLRPGTNTVEFNAPPKLGSRKWCDRRVRSVTLNAWAVWAFSEASHEEEVELPEKFKAMKSSIRTDMLPKWRTAIAQQLMAESEAQRYNPHKAIHNETWVYSNLRNVAWARVPITQHGTGRTKWH